MSQPLPPHIPPPPYVASDPDPYYQSPPAVPRHAAVEPPPLGYPPTKICGLYAYLDGDEMEQFLASVGRSQLYPIWLLNTPEGIFVADGKNRQLAAIAAGKPPYYVWWEGQQGTPDQLTVETERRRNRSQSAKAVAVARDLLPALAEEARARQGSRSDLGKSVDGAGRAAAIASAMTGVNQTYINQAAVIMERGHGDLLNEVEDGERSVTWAYNESNRLLGRQKGSVPRYFNLSTADSDLYDNITNWMLDQGYTIPDGIGMMLQEFAAAHNIVAPPPARDEDSKGAGS